MQFCFWERDKKKELFYHCIIKNLKKETGKFSEKHFRNAATLRDAGRGIKVQTFSF
jgi:hypothetical protein